MESFWKILCLEKLNSDIIWVFKKKLYLRMSYKNLKLINHGLIFYSDLRKITSVFVLKTYFGLWNICKTRNSESLPKGPSLIIKSILPLALLVWTLARTQTTSSAFCTVKSLTRTKTRSTVNKWNSSCNSEFTEIIILLWQPAQVLHIYGRNFQPDTFLKINPYMQFASFCELYFLNISKIYLILFCLHCHCPRPKYYYLLPKLWQ